MSRINGTEMEYSVLIQLTEGYPFIDPATLLTDPFGHIVLVPPTLKRVNTYLTTAGRYYKDPTGHLEYSTPEDDSIDGTVANEIAGERIVYASLLRAREAGRFYDFKLNKRVANELGTSWGYHQNFLGDARKMRIDESSLALLGMFNATVNIFTGAGATLMNYDGKSKFVISQKADSLNADYNSSATKQKPVVNLRRSPYADPKRFVRVHNTAVDANMCPWPIKLKIGATSLVLSLIEQDYDLRHLCLESGLWRVSHQVANDLTLSRTFRLGDAKVKPLNIQTALMEAASKMAGEIELPAEETAVLAEWQQACEDAASDPEKLADRTDWVAKKLMMEEYMGRKSVGWDDPRVRRIDSLWDDLGPNGIGMKLRRTRWAKWMPEEELIKERESNPPSTTRAAIRGRFISELPKSKIKVGWDYLEYNGKKIYIKDPHSTNSSGVDQCIEEHGRRTTWLTRKKI